MASGDQSAPPKMQSTLGLTGLTMNAMALIAPGAFLWLTFGQQCLWGAPMSGTDMWFGIVAALMLCFATAISYAELSKLYPGAGSSYFFAEQAFLSKTHAYKFARLSKFIIGWASHLYYWIYPGVMVGVTAILVGYMANNFWPDTFNPGLSSPVLMLGFCVIFAFGVAYIAYRGVVGATGVNIAINIIQISALLIFSVIAIGYRMSAKDGAIAYSLDPDGNVIKINLATFKVDKDGNPADKDGKSLLDDKGNWPKDPTVAFAKMVPDTDAKDVAAGTAKQVKGPDGSWMVALQTYKVDEKGNPADKDGKPLTKDGKLSKDTLPKLVVDADTGSPLLGPEGTWLIAADEKGNRRRTPCHLQATDDREGRRADGGEGQDKVSGVHERWASHGGIGGSLRPEQGPTVDSPILCRRTRRGQAAQFRFRVHPSDGRDLDPGRFRVRHVDG